MAKGSDWCFGDTGGLALVVFEDLTRIDGHDNCQK